MLLGAMVLSLQELQLEGVPTSEKGQVLKQYIKDAHRGLQESVRTCKNCVM